MIHGSRRSRILSGISSNIFAQASNVIIQLVGIPVLLHYWGVSYYGEWLLLFSIPSYLGMSDLGLGTVATTEISIALAQENYERAQRVFRGAFFSIVLFGLLSCLIFFALIWLLPFHEWLNLEQVSKEELSLTLSSLSVYVFIAIFLTLPLGMYRSIGHYGRGQIISTCFRIAEFISLLIVVANGKGALTAALTYTCIRFVYAAFIVYDLRNKGNWLKLEKISWEWPTIRPLLLPSFSMMASYLGQTLSSQGIVTVIGITLGSTQVVLFSTVRTLCNFSKQIIGIINLSIFTEFSIIAGEKNLKLLRQLHNRSVQANISLTFLSVLGLKIFGPWILAVWTKQSVEITEPFYTLYLIYMLINSFWIGSWNMLLGCNQHLKVTFQYIVLSILNIIASYIYAPIIGIAAIPITFIVSDLVFSYFVLKQSFTMLSYNREKIWANLFFKYFK